MLRRIDLRGFTGDLSDVLPRPETPTGGPVDVVRDILATVAERGDGAVREYTSRFDGVELDSLVVADAELEAAMERIEPDVRAALELAADRIAAYHEAQMPADVGVEQPGVSIRGSYRAVERAACYVPGGRAVYPSTVLMTAVPAQVAGVEQIVVCVPPGPDGKVPDIVLAAAKIAGATRSCRSAVRRRSAQSRMAPSRFGRRRHRRSGQHLCRARQTGGRRHGRRSVVLCRAIRGGRGRRRHRSGDFAAVDVILQAEHGPDGLAWFVTWNDAFADEVTASIERLVADARVVPRSNRPSARAAWWSSPTRRSRPWLSPISSRPSTSRSRRPTMRHSSPWCATPVRCSAAATPRPRSATCRRAEPCAAHERHRPLCERLTVHDFMKDVRIVFVEQAGLEAMGDAVEALAALRVSTLTRLDPPASRSRAMSGPGPRVVALMAGYHSPRSTSMSGSTPTKVRAATGRLRRCRRRACRGDRLAPLSAAQRIGLRFAHRRNYGLSASQVFAANGSNEVLQTLPTFAGPGRSAAVFEPTYARTAISAASPALR